MPKEYQTIVLAALLHDIGKLIQRGKFLHLDKGQHPKFSADFIKINTGVFAQIADMTLLEELVLRHHEDERHFPPELLVQGIKDEHTRMLASLVSKADNLSSSERGKSNEQWQDYKTTPLASVLERLGQEVVEEADEVILGRYHPQQLQDVGSLQSIFPDRFEHYSSGELDKLISGPGSFGDSFKDMFRSDRSQLNLADFDSVLAHLLNILHRYCWSIPSNTQELIPDVSLFDHLKTTATIASCLYVYHKETDTLTEIELHRDDIRRFCLVAGDISGIQSYIFDIASIGVGGGVARRLRARSLYVQLCSEIAAHRLLHSLKLPLALHVIMSSGGRFYLLLPNLSRTKEAVEEMQRFADEWFLSKLNGELSLNLASVEFDDSGFRAAKEKGGGFGTVLNESAKALNERKQKPYGQTILEDNSWQESFFVLPVNYEGQAPCRSCKKFPQWKDELCEHCWLDRSIGARMPQANYVAFCDSQNSGDIPILGYSASVMDSPPNIKQAHPYLTFKLNDPDLTLLANQTAGGKYLANFVALPDSCLLCSEETPTIASFECLANRAQGRKLLGFLKADVDNLGQLFILGLKRKEYSVDTISRVTTLSRMLDLFFTGWVEHLAREEKNLYMVYSGGDDLFVVGPWDKLLLFAGQLRKDFSCFTNNTRITMSAGIVITKPNYPVARAASDANDALEHSKSNKRDKTQKDSITVLGRTLTWQEWEPVCQLWLQLRKSLGQVSSAFLYRLLALSDMWQAYKKGNTMGLRFYPLLAYSIARNLDAKKSPDFYQWIEGLLNPRPGDKEQQLALDNLGLVTTLLIYSKEEV
ncbi:MAG: type III-A CRISPR-associated protein Cas10/Csm1 [Dehalococcoidia bacterium CG2_30_46_19]|nr:MAG: type III-A CRISPR-associated protein Cas10/Csm1 [Dehalococcoidia bacterium CG2_30_46_19]